MKALVLGLIVLTSCAVQPAGVPVAQSTDPVAVVSASVEAYNRRDYDAFVGLLHPEVKLHAFPGTPLYASAEAARAAYRKLFAEAAGLRADVSTRISQGNYVIDQETIHGLPGKEPSTGVAVYEVRAGKIVAIWFVD